MLVRALSAVFGGLIMLSLLFFSRATWLAMVAVLVLVSLAEFYHACHATGARPFTAVGYIASLLFLADAFFAPHYTSSPFLAPGLTVLVMISLIAELPRSDRAPLRNLGCTWLGAIYIGWLFSYVARLRMLDAGEFARLRWPLPYSFAPTYGSWRVDEAVWIVLFTVVVTWASDTGAYLAGKHFGRHKMAPVLSPGKTWEGLGGGVVLALLVAAVVGISVRLPLGWTLTVGLALALIAPLGDLCKSAVKREIGVKDFGHLIPGHGGVLDRFDSMLFTATVTYFCVIYW